MSIEQQLRSLAERIASATGYEYVSVAATSAFLHGNITYTVSVAMSQYVTSKIAIFEDASIERLERRVFDHMLYDPIAKGA